MITLSIIGFCFLGYVCGFAHARFSDYALRTKMWPYNKPDKTPSDGPYREPAKVSFMVTKDQQQALADLGYTKDQRKSMTPSDAHQAIEQQKGPKVIRKGPKSFQEECTDCGCEFEYTLADCSTKVSGGSLYVACPECGNDELHLAL